MASNPIQGCNSPERLRVTNPSGKPGSPRPANGVPRSANLVEWLLGCLHGRSGFGVGIRIDEGRQA